MAAMPPTPKTHAAHPSAEAILALQRTVGNAAVAALLRGGPHRGTRPDLKPVLRSLEHARAPQCDQSPREGQNPGSLVHEVLRSPGRPLGSGPRVEMEARLGADFADVRVHEGAAAGRSAAALGASAYTSGEHIVMGRDGAGSAVTLAHELTHVIQQRSGRVDGSDAGDGLQLSTPDDRFERAAEANARRAMREPVPSSGGAAATAGAAPMPGVGAAARPGPRASRNRRRHATAVQRAKSRFTSKKPQQKNVETPLATLHRHLEEYFDAAGVPEAYAFGTSLTNISPDDKRYSGRFHRAGKMVATINPRTPNRNSKNRNNEVILPYGHFGVMERAIFARGEKGNIYDGGHLVEHVLMSRRDADIHGNIAPQENANFNQQLFRTNERIAEAMMGGSSGVGEFDYTTQVGYPETEYDRTFTQLAQANVVPATLLATLARVDRQKAQTLAALGITFQRWVPRVWESEINMRQGNIVPPQIYDIGTSHTHLKGSLADVEQTVVDPTHIATNTSRQRNPTLKRTFSGTLAGYISTMGSAGPTKVTVGGQQIVTSRFMQPEPMDARDQSPAVFVPGGTVRPVLPPSAVVSIKLNSPFKLSELTDKLREINFDLVTWRQLDSVAKRRSKHYKILRDRKIITNADTGNKFLYSWIQADSKNVAAIRKKSKAKIKVKPPGIDRRTFHTIVKNAKLSKKAGQALFLLLSDPNFLN